MTGKVTEETEPGSFGRRGGIVLARKTNHRRLHPAQARTTTSSFHMKDCTSIHSLLSFYILKKNENSD
jgi:hypothetical protein